MRATLTIALVALAGALVGPPAHATHNHPTKAKKFVVTFVRAYAPCTSPTLTHDPPLAFGACTP